MSSNKDSIEPSSEMDNYPPVRMYLDMVERIKNGTASISDVQNTNILNHVLGESSTENILVLPKPVQVPDLMMGPAIVMEYPKPDDVKGRMITPWSENPPPDIQAQIDSYDLTHPILAHHKKCRCYLCRA